MLARVRLFAVARERAGRSVVEVELSEGATVADLKAAIVAEVPNLAPLIDIMRFAVGSEYADDATPIPPGADLAAIPPVSGGGGD
jgi:molybdopterin converting factor small subunit